MKNVDKIDVHAGTPIYMTAISVSRLTFNKKYKAFLTNILVAISITCHTVFMNISFVIKAAERCFIQHIASKLMFFAFDCSHRVTHLFFVEKYIFVIVMSQ